jgi:hypothetical protein
VTFRCACGVVMRSRDGCVHNQEAVRYFLDVERARAARNSYPILVAVVGLRPDGHPLAADVAAHIFSGLWKGLREVDVVGWLREQRIAGAVLTTGTRRPTREDARSIAQRLQGTIRTGMAREIADRVRVRVIQIPSD